MKIRLGTFNLFQFVEPPCSWYTRKGKFNNSQWFEKTAWIKDRITEMDCHIIGFQEVFSQGALKGLVEELGYHYFETVDTAKLSTNDKMRYVTTTVALASKYPVTAIEEVGVHQPSIEKHHLEDPFHFSRIPIKATIALPNEKELLVYVCHLKSNRQNEFEYIFNGQHTLEHKKEVVSKALQGRYAKALKQRLCEASSLFFDIERSGNRPAVLLCDLNDKAFSITIDALSNNRYHDNTAGKERYLLHDAAHQYRRPVHNPHPEAKEPQRTATSYFLGKGNVLDYIFISDHFDRNNKDRMAEVTGYTVLNDHLQRNRNGSLLTSDHAQVVCELTFGCKEDPDPKP